MVSFLKLLCSVRCKKMSYGTSLYDKINFFYIAANFNGPGGYQDSVQKFQKNCLTFLGLGTNVVKVSSVNLGTFVPVGHPNPLGHITDYVIKI